MAFIKYLTPYLGKDGFEGSLESYKSTGKAEK